MATAKTTTYKAIGKYLMEQIGGAGFILVPETDEEGNDYELEIPKLKWYDKQRGQVQHFTKELGIPFPAVLISFPDTGWETLGAGSQKGATLVRITTLFENFADSFYGSPNQDDALRYFHFNDLIFETLQGLSGQSFSSLTRVAEREDEDHDFLIITEIDFATELSEAGRTRIERETGSVNPVHANPRPPAQKDERVGQFVVE